MTSISELTYRLLHGTRESVDFEHLPDGTIRVVDGSPIISAIDGLVASGGNLGGAGIVRLAGALGSYTNAILRSLKPGDILQVDQVLPDGEIVQTSRQVDQNTDGIAVIHAGLVDRAKNNLSAEVNFAEIAARLKDDDDIDPNYLRRIVEQARCLTFDRNGQNIKVNPKYGISPIETAKVFVDRAIMEDPELLEIKRRYEGLHRLWNIVTNQSELLEATKLIDPFKQVSSETGKVWSSYSPDERADIICLVARNLVEGDTFRQDMTVEDINKEIFGELIDSGFINPDQYRSFGALKGEVTVEIGRLQPEYNRFMLSGVMNDTTIPEFVREKLSKGAPLNLLDILRIAYFYDDASWIDAFNRAKVMACHSCDVRYCILRDGGSVVGEVPKFMVVKGKTEDVSDAGKGELEVDFSRMTFEELINYMADQLDPEVRGVTFDDSNIGVVARGTNGSFQNIISNPEFIGALIEEFDTQRRQHTGNRKLFELLNIVLAEGYDSWRYLLRDLTRRDDIRIDIIESYCPDGSVEELFVNLSKMFRDYLRELLEDDESAPQGRQEYKGGNRTFVEVVEGSTTPRIVGSS